MTSGIRVLIVLLGASLLVSSAAAQAPTASVEIEDAPTSTVISNRGVAIVSLNVTTQLSGIVCSAPASFAVQVVGSATQDTSGNASENVTLGNATVNVTPAELQVTVPAGAYGNNPGLPAAQPYENRQTIAVSVESAGLPNETTYRIDILATLRAPTASNCRGTAAVPTATAEGTFEVTFNNTQPVMTPSPEIPVPWPATPLALVAVVVLLRRRV